MKIIPVILIKNEEVWIERVLSPLISVFGQVIVTDTGSTDGTKDIVNQMIDGGAAILFNMFPDEGPAQLTVRRQMMQDQARDIFDATHIFLVDGDELYPTKYLRFIHDFPMPENALSGFTWGKEIRELENGELWYLQYLDQGDLGLNRQAIISVDSKWSGSYPFESPSTYVPGDPTNYYWKSPDESFHFFHLHQTTRSHRDQDVYIRMKKKNQLSMRETPDVKPYRIWLNSEREYVDD